MLKYVIAYLATGLVFAVVDAVWLTWSNERLYRPTLNPVLADEVNLKAAAVFYVVYILGIMALVVSPATSWTKAMTTGAILGAVCYATYDLTNQATLKVWSTKITLADITWGAFVTALAATAGYLALRWARAKFG
ncbi:DUF2177 family protein [Phenylobacterium sp.]|uniref:DUF2177 family protein n=1 Tax=Phenylobacterium sp. TaxID=1871053 RepID=UPI00271747F5|nr:DUF2177 family protein [Phenylobacterium sp.]MDO8321506.1 DUF2177 family protein [Phenylobacterium sp.]MDP3632464.1 DUF2177 family protein [Phenylobacterium sp.]MDP3869535.1 DUF2177 family protein [Phenylobacterium sp.]